jgi:hypothetical protein
VNIMSGKTSWLRKKKPGLVASTTSAMNPVGSGEAPPDGEHAEQCCQRRDDRGVGASHPTRARWARRPAQVQKNNGGLITRVAHSGGSQAVAK